MRKYILQVSLCVCFILLCVAQPCLAQQSSGVVRLPNSSAVQNHSLIIAPSATSDVAQPIPAYPNSPKGLEELMKQMLKLQKAGDAKALAPYLQSLILPSPDEWFRATFGEQIGEQLADSYSRTSMELPLSFPGTLSELERHHLTRPHAVMFTDSCNPKATEKEYPLLFLRTAAQPLYDVRFFNGNTITLIPYFAFVNGKFRYLGNLQVTSPAVYMYKFPSAHSKPGTVMVRGEVMQGRLIKQVQPIYPNDAKARGIQGTVILHGIIGTDGTLRDLQFVQGSCLLVKAAMDAVRQWRYAPYLLNGEPVQVDTKITVTFNLRR